MLLLLMMVLSAEYARRQEPIRTITSEEVFVDAVNEALAKSTEKASVSEMLDVVVPLKKKRVRKPAARQTK